MKLSKLFYGAFALILLASCGNKTQGNRQASTQKYPTTEVVSQPIELTTTYSATLKGQQDIEIRPRIDGFIDAIYIDEGSVVKKGQQLFKINSPQSEQALTSAQAAVTMAQAAVNTAKINAERIKPLAEKGIVGMIQYETAKDNYESALAGLDQAKANLKNAKAMIGWTNVTSPVSGFVGAIPLRLGSLVNSMNVLTTVANVDSIYAYFSMNEKDFTSFLSELEGETQAEKLKNAAPVSLTLANGKVFEEKGKIGTITGSVNVSTGSVSFRAVFPNKNYELRSGMSGRITIPTQIDHALVIPQKAVFEQQNKTLVYQVQGDSVALKSITVLPAPDGKHYVVTNGLNEKDVIVTDGIVTLFHGKKIVTE